MSDSVRLLPADVGRDACYLQPFVRPGDTILAHRRYRTGVTGGLLLGAIISREQHPPLA